MWDHKFLLLMASAVILNVTALLFARYAYEHDSRLFTLLTMATLSLSGFSFSRLLRYGFTTVINVMWIALSTLGITTLGYLIYREPLSQGQAMGIAIVLIGLFLLSTGEQTR